MKWAHRMLVTCDAHYKHRLPCQRKTFAPSVCAHYFVEDQALVNRLTVNTQLFTCMVYVTSDVSFPTLIKDAQCFHAIRNCDNPTTLGLLYDPGAQHKYGAFKRACFGHVDLPVLGSNSVVIKQCFYNCLATGKMLPYENHSQVAKLSSEINCLRWASALMGLVYDHIDKHIAEHGPPPTFSVPRMRFVKSALAVMQESHDTFLLEEVIDEGVEGHFVKYIGNGSAWPFDFLADEEMHRAKFLSFCQHLQYVKTKSNAYVGDFQGE